MAEQEIKEKPKRRVHVGRMTLGLVLCGFALLCAGADVYSNFIFGMQKNVGMGVIFTAAAVALVIIPEVAGEDGWCVPTAFLTIVCLGLSVAAGMSNHLNSQAIQALAVDGVNRRYDDSQAQLAEAEADIKRAKADIEAAKEPAGSKELRDIVATAEGDVKRESDPANGGCGRKAESKCQMAIKRRDAAQARLTNASAREAAEARLADALARAEKARGSAPAAKMATHKEAEQLAKLFGADMKTTADNWDTFLALLLVIGSTCGAVVFHRGRRLAAGAFTIEGASLPAKPAAKVKAKAKQRIIVKAAETETFNQAKAIELFLADCVVADPNGELISGDAHARMASWWNIHFRQHALPTSCAFGKAMTKKFGPASNGQRRYKAKLKAVTLKAVA